MARVREQRNQAFLKDSLPVVGRIQQRFRHRAAHRSFEERRRIQQLSLTELFPGIADTRVMVQCVAPTPSSLGNVACNELLYISAICKYINARQIVEFGTYDGLTALHLAINSPANAKIKTIDLPADHPIRLNGGDDGFYTEGVLLGRYFSAAPEADKIDQVLTDSKEWNHVDFKKGTDLVFVDGGHVYDVVKSDSQKALEMVRDGGVVLWHDYHYAHTGVARCLNELAAEYPLVQVIGTALVCYLAPCFP
jgi:hypothetical protein